MTDEKERESADLIHPTAIIDPRAEIGKGVKIGPYAVIGPNRRRYGDYVACRY